MSRIILGQGNHINTLPQSADIDLDGLIDVIVTSPQQDQVLKYDAGQWRNTSTGAITGLDSLSDVTVTNVQNGQVLQYNTTTSLWENQFVDALVTVVDGGTY